MLLELIGDVETDIISALEQKCFRDDAGVRFKDDPRVIGAVQAISSKIYDLSEFRWNPDLLTFLDDYWVFSYLLKETGNIEACDNIRKDLFTGFDPFSSYNPVTKVFAYCEAIEDSRSVEEIKGILGRMDQDIGCGGSQVYWRAYPLLQKVAEHHLRYVERLEDYERRVMRDIVDLVRDGASKVKEWEMTQAAKLYEKARDLAEYQLHDADLAERISEHLKIETDRLAKDASPADRCGPGGAGHEAGLGGSGSSVCPGDSGDDPDKDKCGGGR